MLAPARERTDATVPELLVHHHGSQLVIVYLGRVRLGLHLHAAQQLPRWPDRDRESAELEAQRIHSLGDHQLQDLAHVGGGSLAELVVHAWA